jgi:nucleoside-diphosphate-sugar epimerase
MKKYLVTGGTGFLGSALVRKLLSSGNDVRILDNNARGTRRRIEDIQNDVELLEGDVRDSAVVSKALKGRDCVCHLAYINGTEYFYARPELVLEVGVKGMTNVIDGCLQQGVGELVLASSSEVYQTPTRVPTDENAPLVVPDPRNPRYSYGAGKIISELLALHWARKHMAHILVFRPHNVYGPDMGWEHVIPQLLLRAKTLLAVGRRTADLPIQGSGDETRAFIFIDDFVDGLWLILRHGVSGEIYNIGTENEICIREVAKEVGRYFGAEVTVVPGTAPMGATSRRCPDISKLRTLGFTPQIGLRDGVRRTGDWYVANEHLRAGLKA